MRSENIIYRFSFFLLMVGGSSGGTDVVVFNVVRGGTNGGAARRALPAEVERTDAVSSKFRAN